MGAASTDRHESTRDGSAIARAGVIVLVLSWIVNVVIATVAPMAGVGEELMAMVYPSVLALTAFGVIGATLVYAALQRFTGRPDRTFVIVAVVVLALSVIPDFTYIPNEPGGSLAAGAVLASMHVITAAIVLWQLVDWRAVR